MNDRPQSGNVSEKKAAAVSAVSLVRVGMVVGIGTGSTAAYAISKLGELVAGGLDIVGIPKKVGRSRCKKSGADGG
jgi:ribose 5-phosphate isomerase A